MKPHLIALLLLVLSPFAFAAGPLESRLAGFLLTETVEGRMLAERVIGYEISAGDEAELQQFRERLEPAARTELEGRLKRLEKELADRIPEGKRSRRGELTPLERAYAREYAQQALILDPACQGDCFRLLPAKRLTFATNREAFLAGPRATNSFYAEAYPTSNWQGTLSARLARLAKKWPKAVTLEKAVRFEFHPEEGAVRRTTRPVLVIAKGALNEGELAEFTRDYLAAISEGTVSFPLGENGGHLYTRLGNEVVDYVSGLSRNPYQLPNSPRLEPVIALESGEERKLVEYVDNALRDSDRVIGSFEYDGVANGRTHGELTDNRPAGRGQGHNCTSWLCTAPIGARGTSVIRMVGATPKLEVHTNPGWWSSYLTGAAPKERVPVVVYWSDANTLARARAQGMPGGKMKWEFGTH